MMKTRNLLGAAVVLTLFSFGFKLQDRGWENVKNKTPLTGPVAVKIISFDANDPESVARYFYAAKLKRSSQWRNVVHKLESEWTIKMKTAMNVYNNWTFKKVTLQKKRNLFESEVHFMITYEAMEKGKPKRGSGEVIVQKVNGKWEVHEVPY